MGPARSVRGHPEAVQLRRTDPGPGAAEASQPALPHTRPSQRACFPVTNSDLVLFSILLLYHSTSFSRTMLQNGVAGQVKLWSFIVHNLQLA